MLQYRKKVDNFYKKKHTPPLPPLKIAVFFVIFGVMVSPMFASAWIYPNDAITRVESITGVNTITLFSPASGSFNTILGVSMVQSGLQSNTELYCGSYLLARNYDKDLAFVPFNYVCGNTLSIVKTGQGDTSVSTITYVPYDITTASNSSLGSFYQGLENNATPLKTFAFITAGDLIIVLMLGVLVMLSLLTIWFRKV